MSALTSLIDVGSDYAYVAAFPQGRAGHRYRAHRIVIAVPTDQEQVLVECLTGPDAGRWFTVSAYLFLRRYAALGGTSCGAFLRDVEGVDCPDRLLTGGG